MMLLVALRKLTSKIYKIYSYQIQYVNSLRKIKYLQKDGLIRHPYVTKVLVLMKQVK